MSVALLMISVVIVFVMFESRKIKTNIYSKLNSKEDLFLTLLKFLLVLVFSLLNSESFKAFKIIILVVFSIITYLNFRKHRPYYR